MPQPRNKRSVRLISKDGSFITHQLFLGDMDISNQVLGMTLDIHPSKGWPEPRLTLEIFPGQLSLDSPDAIVQLTQENHDLLIRLGWTPPPEKEDDG